MILAGPYRLRAKTRSAYYSVRFLADPDTERELVRGSGERFHARCRTPGPKIMGESRLSGDWCLLCCAGGVWWLGGLDRVEAHGEPQRVGLAHDAAHGAFGVESSEVVAAEIGVVDVVGEHVPDRS